MKYGKNKKKIYVITIVLAVLLLVVGISFAAFVYRENTSNQQLVLGDIYMYYNEINQLTFEKAMPSETYNSDKYFEFTISGKNTNAKQNIIYEIKLSHGDDHETRKTRINDEFLKFTLVEEKNDVEKVVVDGASFSNLSNQRIWISTIPMDTQEEIKITYRLYMWVSEDVEIGNTADVDYNMDTWNSDVFASVKVNVTGDFNNKIMIGEDGLFEYALLSNGEIQLSKYLGNETNVVIPANYDGYQVYSIGNLDATTAKATRYNIFNTIGNTSVKSITIEDGVEVIGMGAFDRCSGLTGEINIPDSVTKIEAYAFYQSTNLSGTLDLPDSLTLIGRLAFSGCTKLSGELVIPSTVKTMDAGAFQNCSSLTSLTFEENSVLTLIPENAFYGCANLAGELKLPDTITSIGKQAFYELDKLTGDLIIPDLVTSIGIAAFQGCAGFDGKLTLSKNLVEISDYAFNHCLGFTNTTLDIPTTLQSVGTNETEGTHVFYDFATKTIEEYTVNGLNNGVGTNFKVVDGVLYTSDQTRLIAYPASKVGNSYIMPEGVVRMDELSFSRAGSTYSGVPDTGIKSLTLPNSYVISTTLPSSYINQGNTLTTALYIYTGIEEILVKDDNLNYTSNDGILYSKDMSTLWYIPHAKVGNIVLPNTLTTIKTGSLSLGRLAVSNIYIPASVTNIEATAILEINQLGSGKVTFDPNCIYQFNASNKVVKNS